MESTTSNRKSPEERKEILARQLAGLISQGRRIESQSDFQAVVMRGHSVNHILHFLLMLFTIGLWGLVWIALLIFGGIKREMVQVDEWGIPTVARL